MLGSTQQQNVLGERTYEGVCELRFHEGGGGAYIVLQIMCVRVYQSIDLKMDKLTQYQ